MKHLILLVLILILGACSNGDIPSIVKAEEITQDAFQDWLSQYELTPNDFADTSRQEAFELWAYSDTIVSTDSSLFWYPSTDSSYYLVSNYNIEDGSRAASPRKDIELRFHEVGTNEIRLGISLIDSLGVRKVDIHWKDASSIYILEPYDSREYALTLIHMKHDTIWVFETKKPTGFDL